MTSSNRRHLLLSISPLISPRFNIPAFMELVPLFLSVTCKQIMHVCRPTVRLNVSDDRVLRHTLQGQSAGHCSSNAAFQNLVQARPDDGNKTSFGNTVCEIIQEGQYTK